MSDPLDAALVFGFLSFFQLWGGFGIGAGLTLRKALPVLWGVMVGVLPLYFGIERGTTLGQWGALAWQVGVLLLSALLIAFRLPRLRRAFGAPGMTSLMVGSFIMAGGALLGAWFFRLGSEIASLAFGGIGFLFGAMWFGAGIKQLRGK
jgi:hypothetical protein